MSDRFWAAVAAGALLVFASGAGASAAGQPAELCEAFPWDVPVEQSFTPASVLRWRRDFESVRREQRCRPSCRTAQDNP
jgi:hypothetical protein